MYRWGNRLTVAAGTGSGGLLHLFLPLRIRLGQAADQDVGGCPPFHAAALVRSFGIVAHEIDVDVSLHGLDAVVELLAHHDAEVLVEQGAVQALDEDGELPPPHLGGALLDLLELDEQLVGVAIWPAAECAAVVR